ncbi:GT2 family glycosyltransferase/glycosyltransferase involved in cell wall biosynthesis [Ochrobactrum sp. P6BSIII]|uniref:glycosyltransferase n=1 Tax=unclassified Ochrobactrum TaxID=239106 RepID=UPI000992ABA6|nr:GT2 family glycosyltransferase/glycosyltransferase involved in cell wall biosynthesis [Ochrobactrum sp. P6BSIII]
MLRYIKSHLTFLPRNIAVYRTWKNAKTIRNDHFFDEAWYLETYPDVKASGVSAASHYLQFGGLEGRDPSPGFSSLGYLDANPDVATTGANPLLHYIMWGRSEGRSYAPVQNTEATSVAAQDPTPAVELEPQIIQNRYRLVIDSISPSHIRGWCVDEANISTAVKLTLLINDSVFGDYLSDNARSDLQAKGISSGLGGFNIDNPIHLMGEGSYQICFQFPDGSRSDEVVLKNEERRRSYSIHPDDLVRNGITIVVPVYNAPRDLEICIDRLLRWTPEYAKILIIDDKSPDPEIGIILDRQKNNARVTILRNEANLGFTKTSNRGILEAGRDDVILLNSDARVTPGWLDGLLMAAASSPRVATVTPMSDRAGAFSAPKIGNDNELPVGVDEIAFAKSFRRTSSGVYPVVPTGNGFCLFIKRACIDEVGNLDSEAFPRGYGEENDFCMRALHAGWKHIIDDRTYVFHDRSKSFGENKHQLLEEGAAVLRERYPEYKASIAVFGSSEKIRIARFNGYIAQKKSLDGQISLPRVMFVISTTTGGTPQTNRDLITGVNGSIDAWLLRCDRKIIELSHLVDGEFKVVRSHRLQTAVSPVSHFSAEYDAVVFSWLFEFDIDLVHIRHLAWHSLSLPTLAKKLGRKTITSFHDYYAISPTIKLLDDEGKFLGETFTTAGAANRESLWPIDSMPLPTGTWLDTWRRKFAKALSASDAFVTTSSHARSLILDKMPELDGDKFFVIPHGRDFREFLNISQHAHHDSPIRILVPGNINTAKGLDVIYSLLDKDTDGKIEFHVLGGIQDHLGRSHPRLINHGRYARESFAAKAAEIKPHLGAVFSIWDETYCHTLTELWSVGLPSIVFDFPTLAERVTDSGCGWVLSHFDIDNLYREIIRVTLDQSEQHKVRTALARWQAGDGKANTVRVMASKYYDIYRDVLNNRKPSVHSERSKCVAVVCPSAPNLNIANASTYIRVWERTQNTLDRSMLYIRMLPETLLAAANCGAIDAAIIQRTAIPPEMTDSVIDALRSSCIPFIYDIDDDLLGHAQRSDSAINYETYKAPIEALLQSASVVTVSTEQLSNIYDGIAGRIEIVPNMLSSNLWNAAPLPRRNDGFIRALYMGTPTHDADLEMILPALANISKRYPTFRLTVVGISQNTDLIRQIPWIEQIDPPSRIKPYISFVPWLREIASRCDFAIAPLVDNHFNRCKSDLKVLEYSALGLPIVASDLPQYRIEAPFLTLVEGNPQSWEKALDHVIRTGTRNVQTEAQQRNWVLTQRMLTPTLPSFDALIAEQISAATPK